MLKNPDLSPLDILGVLAVYFLLATLGYLFTDFLVGIAS